MLLGLALIAYLSLSGAIDWSALLSLVSGWRLSGAAVGLLFLVIILVSLRLTILLSARGFLMPFPTALRLILIGGFFSAFLPGAAGGDVARMVLAARTNPGRGVEIGTIIGVDRFVGLLSLLTLPLLVAIPWEAGSGGQMLAGLPGLLSLALLGLVLGLAIILACWFSPLRSLAVGLLSRIRLGDQAARLFETLDGYRSSKRALIGAFVLSLLVQACSVAAILTLVRATGGSPISLAMVVAVPFGKLANALPLTPGGLGVGEAAFLGLFASIGATGGAEALLAWRVLTTVFDLVGGALLVIGRIDMAVEEPGLRAETGG